jgi:hypothetical protein
MEAHQAAIVEIPEQSDRTGSSGYQVDGVAMPVDGVIEVDPTATDLQIRLFNRRPRQSERHRSGKSINVRRTINRPAEFIVMTFQQQMEILALEVTELFATDLVLSRDTVANDLSQPMLRLLLRYRMP